MNVNCKCPQSELQRNEVISLYIACFVFFSSNPKQLPERALSCLLVLSVRAAFSVKGGRDISNIRSVRLCIGCPEIFPNKHSLIQLGWADLSTD